MNPVKLVLQHPIVQSRITRLLIVSSCLMSIANSEHVLGGGKKKEETGNCENSGNARLICKGNEVDIKGSYCLPLNLPGPVSLEVSLISLNLHPACLKTDGNFSFMQKRIYILSNKLLNK